MATKSLQSLHHHHHHHHSLRRDPPPTTLSSSSSFKPNPNTTSSSLSQSISFTPSSSLSASSTTTTTATTPSTSLDLLQQHLSSQNFREADEQTRRLLIVLAGEQAQKRGYVFFSEVQFISETDLKTIDELWRQHSNDKFGYSVQKKIWKRAKKDFTGFFIKVGWMKKLETEVVQYNYRAFPNEFIWEVNEGTPEGHLPLTNALRGTQLLSSILNHPAFEDGEEDEEEEGGNEGRESGGGGGLMKGLMGGAKTTVFKPDYSF